MSSPNLETITGPVIAIFGAIVLYVFNSSSQKNKLECSKLTLEIEILEKQLGKKSKKSKARSKFMRLSEVNTLKWIGFIAGAITPIYGYLLFVIKRVTGIEWTSINENFWEELFLDVIILTICGSLGRYLAPRIYSKLDNWLVAFVCIVVFSAIIDSPLRVLFRPTIQFLMQVYYR